MELLKAEQEFEFDFIEIRVRDAILAKDGLIEELQEALELEQVRTEKLGDWRCNVTKALGCCLSKFIRAQRTPPVLH